MENADIFYTIAQRNSQKQQFITVYKQKTFPTNRHFFAKETQPQHLFGLIIAYHTGDAAAPKSVTQAPRTDQRPRKTTTAKGVHPGSGLR